MEWEFDGSGGKGDKANGCKEVGRGLPETDEAAGFGPKLVTMVHCR